MSTHNKIINQLPAPKKTGFVFIYCGIIAAFTFIVFQPSLNNGFTNWDDNYYVEKNPDITGLSLQNIARVFSSSYVGNYQPVTMLTYMMEYHFFQLNPFVYHFSNLLLHIINSLLVFVLIYSLSKSYLTSFLVCMLFAVHPMRVESVAWIAERKDVLSAFFYFLSLLSYIRYLNKGNRKFYYLCGFSLLLSLLSKPMAVSLPFILPLVYYLKNGRLNKKILIDIIPFFAIAAVFVVITLIAQKNAGAISEYPVLSMAQRICIPFYGMVFYLIKSIVPVHLSAFYPFPDQLDSGYNFNLFVSPFLVIGIAAAIYHFRTFSRTIAFGTLFFLITALPVLQIIPIGNTIVAERYTYIPLLGIYFIFATLFAYLLTKKYRNNSALQALLIAGASISLIFFAYLSNNRCNVWKDSFSLWNDVIDKFPVAVAYNNRGVAYNSEGIYNNALKDYNIAIRLNPSYAPAYNNRGAVYYVIGNYENAIEDYNQAIRLIPSYASAYNNRGAAFNAKGNYDNAIEDFNQALKYNSKYFEAYYNRGFAYSNKGDIDRSIDDFTIAIKFNPLYFLAYNDRGFSYCQKGDYDHAIEDITQALKLNPNYIQAYNNRGFAWNAKGDHDRAIEDFSQAISLNPNCKEAYYNRGLAFKAKGDDVHALKDNKTACNMGYDLACKALSTN